MKYPYYLLFLFLFSCKKEVSQILPVVNQVVNSTQEPISGFKVNPNARLLGKDYWENTGVPTDLVGIKYLISPRGFKSVGSSMTAVCGDFNNDGWIDVFQPGMSNDGITNVSTSFLIWNPVTKVFENKNLFNNNQIDLPRSNSPKVIPTYLNNDNYVDLIIFGYFDEEKPENPPTKMMLAISDGKGNYDLKEITTETPTFYHYGGDLGYLNEDNVPDLVLNCGGLMKILWGSNSFPYFDESNSITFSNPQNRLQWTGVDFNFGNNNGFGDPNVASLVWQFVHNCKISDVNKDGKNDIVLCSYDDSENSNKVLINLGGGRFNIKSIINLPLYSTDKSKYFVNIDYIIDDINGDGNKDIISLNETDYRTWDIFIYLNQGDGTYKVDKSIIQYNINSIRHGNWKHNLIYFDYDGDGKKDISYVDDADNGESKYKSVFIRTGNQFIETDYYKFTSKY
jgi:hypothetical protein